MEAIIEVMVLEEMVGIEDLPCCGDDERDCEDFNWVEIEGNSNAAENG